MQPEQWPPRTHLFTVRLWAEPVGHDRHEVRMRVMHVLSGEIRYFRAWPALVAFLLAKLQAQDTTERGKAAR